MWTKSAAPVFRIVEGAWQQLSGARRLDDVDGAVGPELRALGVEWHEEVQPLTGIGVCHREQRGVGNVEIGLIERNLYSVVRECLFQPVTFNCAPVLGVDCLWLP